MVLRVWTREGELHAVGEATEGMLPLLAWQPNGRHLYAAQASPGGGQRVVLFETNGLQHGGFDILQAGAGAAHARSILIPEWVEGPGGR